jgi:hypothetical protein
MPMSTASSRLVACALAGLLAIGRASPAATAEAAADRPVDPPAPATEPPARLVVDAPLPGPLARGAVVVPFHAEHLQIAPVYGAEAARVSPRLGHLHLTVDHAPWHWVQASGDLIVLQGLDAGTHTQRVDLADAQHRVLDSRTVEFTLPER